MNLEWHEWVALVLLIILLFTPAIAFWWAGYVWEKHNKEKEQTQEYYVATTDADEED